MELIKRATSGGYVKTAGGDIGRIVGFDAERIEYDAVDGEKSVMIARAKAFKATSTEYKKAAQERAEADIRALATVKATRGTPAPVEKEGTAKHSPDESEAKEKAVVKDSYRSTYTKTKSASGGSSLACGDSVSQILAGRSLTEVAYALEEISTIFGERTTVAEIGKRYAHLNIGLARMSIGNRIRAICTENIRALAHLRGMFKE